MNEMQVKKKNYVQEDEVTEGKGKLKNKIPLREEQDHHPRAIADWKTVCTRRVVACRSNAEEEPVSIKEVSSGSGIVCCLGLTGRVTSLLLSQ